MSYEGIVVGQRVDPKKAQRARDLRRQMTSAERILWGRLRAHKTSGPHIRRQQVIDGFIVDFYCHEARLVIEVDGSTHDAQPDYDAERDRILISRGLRVLRIRNEEVLRDLDAVVAHIAELIRSEG